jgi:hypothetical protein
MCLFTSFGRCFVLRGQRYKLPSLSFYVRGSRLCHISLHPQLIFLGFFVFLGPQPFGDISHPNVRFNHEFIAAVAASFCHVARYGIVQYQAPPRSMRSDACSSMSLIHRIISMRCD